VLGIGFRFSQPPLAYVKKSWPGFTDGSMLAARKSVWAGEFVVVTGVEHAAVKVTADMLSSLRESIIVLVAREGDLSASGSDIHSTEARSRQRHS